MDYSLNNFTPMENVKGLFPFRIGTTSYILPVEKDNLLTNVEYLKNSFDKIQLLLFGKNYLNDILDPPIMKQLQKIQKETDILFSVHLPLDFDLLHPAAENIAGTMAVILSIIEQTAGLHIDEYILHLDRCENFTYPPVLLNNTTRNIFETIVKELSRSLGQASHKIHIENTAYDLTFFKEIILKYDYKICMDIGHLILWQHDFDDFIKCFKGQIREVHLHGADNKNDHLSLSKLSPSLSKKIMGYLRNYTGSVVIEVFNETDLSQSLQHLKQCWFSEGEQ